MGDRATTLYEQAMRVVHRRTDHLFFSLLLAQWVAALAIAVGSGSPGDLLQAVLVGGAYNLPPLVLILLRPGDAATRRTVAVSQLLWSGLLVQLSGGRTELHFHVFCSLAVLALYGDLQVLFIAMVATTADQLAREVVWARGTTGGGVWAWLEQTGWLVFEGGVLAYATILRNQAARRTGEREAALEVARAEVERRVEERTRELAETGERYRRLLENTDSLPIEVDLKTDRIVYLPPHAARFLGADSAHLTQLGLQQAMRELIHPDDHAKVFGDLGALVGSTDPRTERASDFRILKGDREVRDLHAVFTVTRPELVLHGIIVDVTEQRRLEVELRQSQKLESVGRLASGVAHEINTPVQFVSDSVHFLQEGVQDLFTLLEVWRGAVAEASPARQAEAARAEQAADLDYLKAEVPKALQRSLEGLGRVTSIVRAMKEFAHPDRKEMIAVDLNHAVESTLTIARNEYKYVAELETELGELPPVTCHSGELNQALLNLVVNAAHAIADRVKGTEQRGRITVRTWREGELAVISVADTGTGIPERARARVFDPFFTTKEVGRGTGQGLAIARSVVTDKHHGTLSFETEVGRGTTFFIRIPIAPPGAQLGVAA